MSQKCKLLNRAVHVKEQVSEEGVARLPISRLGFSYVNILDVYIVTSGSLRKAEWLEAYKTAKTLRKNCSKVSTQKFQVVHQSY